jgi:hypothetical protein
MRQLNMSWNTERGHLICRWIESSEKCGPFSFVDRLRLSFNPRNQSGDALGER